VKIDSPISTNQEITETKDQRSVITIRRLVGVRRVLQIQSVGPIAILIALCLIFEVVRPDFLTLSNVVTIIETAAIPLILATGLTFVILLGSIDLSLEGIMATSSMVLALLVKNNVNSNDWGVFGLITAVTAGAVFGLINGILNALFKMPSLIVTLGTWFIGLGVAAMLFPASPPIMHEPIINHLTARFLGVSLIVYIALFIVLLGFILLRYTHLGRMIYAIGGDENIAVASGIPVGRYKMAAFLISGLLAAVSGSLLSAQLSNGNPQIGDGTLFPAISGAVLGGTLLSGGRGGVLQSTIGVLILEVLGVGLIQSGADPYTQTAIQGIVIILAVTCGSWYQRRRLRVIK
jgi:ribose transport system permease protein